MIHGLSSARIVESPCVCRVRGDPIVQDCDGQILNLVDVGFFEVASYNGSDACPTFRVSDVITISSTTTNVLYFVVIFQSFVATEIVDPLAGLVIPTDFYLFINNMMTIKIEGDLDVRVRLMTSSRVCLHFENTESCVTCSGECWCCLSTTAWE